MSAQFFRDEICGALVPAGHRTSCMCASFRLVPKTRVQNRTGGTVLKRDFTLKAYNGKKAGKLTKIPFLEDILRQNLLHFYYS